jgi:dimethylhistidine N-methyltransferase
MQRGVFAGATSQQQDASVPQGILRTYDFLPAGDRFLQDVLTGLAAARKAIPSRHFFDEAGLRLFQARCGEPECYADLAETTILGEHSVEVAQFVGPRAHLIQFGLGAAASGEFLIECVKPPLYSPMEVSLEALAASTSRLARRFPWLNIGALAADYVMPPVLPEFVGVAIERKAVYCPGFTLSCLSRSEALDMLVQARRLCGSVGVLLVGIDLGKHRRLVESSWNDAQGLSAKFNLNLLERMNRELGADFQPRRFRHQTCYDERNGWLELYVESLYSQFVRIHGRRFDFAPRESVLTGRLCQYGLQEFEKLAGAAGLVAKHVWTDVRNVFCVQGLVAA